MRTCQLEGCEKSLEGMHGLQKYCCPNHKGKANSWGYKPAPRHFETCQLEGCENSLEGMVANKKYCCDDHKEIRDRQTPKRKAYAKEWQRRPERKAYSKAWKQNPKYKAQQKIYNQRPEVKAKMKAYRKEYKQLPKVKEYNRIYDQKRRAQKHVIPATYTLKDWNNCLEYFDHKCAYCGVAGALHQDHFIPFANGGPYTPDNIVCACSSCNMGKSAKAPEDWCTPEQYERVVDYLLERVGN